LLLGVVALGCGADTTSPARLDGVWLEDFTVPGSFLTLNLTSTGSSISGDGSWCGEALGCGTVAIAGSTNGNAVHLDLTLTQQTPQVGPGTVEHFDGRLTLVNSLDGTLSSDPPGVSSAHVVFHHPPTDPI
jgi:hypothetical protein